MSVDEAIDYEYDYEYDEGMDESDEASDEAWQPRRISLPRATLPPPRPTSRPVTQAQFQMAVQRLDGYINRNGAAIKRVNASVTTLGRDVKRQGGQLKTIRQDLSTARDAIILLPLLTNAFKGTNSTLGALLPILLLGGFGSSGGQSGSGGGLLGSSDSTTMMIMVLALSGALGRQQ
ncbi:hypothetical protein [Nocardia arthritidis]|uniref:Uncharacterized protein n=1 Tax=Nocardia arthritidis TaxID=228602 RepID=A0A6G9YMS4_9NOCA|nr:hypothetical protein [Nocardia arthritidis]QIS14223.1 hypothetical protein F5544_31920 [Nocardia arthritidis]